MKLLTYDELPEASDSGRGLVHIAAFGGFPRRRAIAMVRRQSTRLAEYVGVFAVERGEVIGQAWVEHFPYTFPHGTETVSGIAGVATRLDRARSGIARQILEEIHRRERESGISYSTLWTNRSWGAHRLYETLGYRDIYQPPFAVRVGPTRNSSSGRARIRPGRSSDLDVIEELHARFGAGRWGFATRERGLNRLSERTGDFHPKKQLLVITVDGRPRGYAIVDRTPDRTVCGELVAGSASLRSRLGTAVEARAGSGAVAFRDGAVDSAGPGLRARGYAVAPAGWFGLMGMPFSRPKTQATVVREFGAGGSRFLCFHGDRF